MEDDAPEGKAHATFERLEDVKKWQKSLFSLDLFREPTDEQQKLEAWAEQKFSSTLAEYQEQSYLLDPFLEELVTPIVEHLKSYARLVVADPSKNGSSIRVNRLSTLLYHYIKFRGYKTIIRFFPHEVADLTIVLDFAYVPGGPMDDPSQWALRYVILLWLYLICIIPFDLAQFDEPTHPGRTTDLLENLAKGFLSKAGLERQGAALLLSRLYMRKDASHGFHHFVVWSESVLKEGTDSAMVLGILQVLCEVTKSGSAEQVQSEVIPLMSLARILQEDATLSKNTIIRKYKTKLLSRIAVRLLPAKAIAGRKNVRQLSGSELLLDAGKHEDFDVPNEVDEIVEQLLGALQDKDTIVRWSGAKGIARITERLPHDFADQVLESILGLFDIHSAAATASYDLPAVAEGTWHGACLACAELARRSIIEAQYLPKLIDCLAKALSFDVRKGAHSIGSNVRDAAAYVVWALARTQNRVGLVPHTEMLAQRLMAATLFDREVHIRRAASAAFQEHVGRTGLFPHGIVVLGKTDFYAVSIRKHAFLIAAPQVAQHVEYRRFLFDHLLDVVLRHWDITMRELGAESLRLICAYDLDGLVPVAIDKLVHLLDSLDTADVHGSLTSLSQIAIAFKDGIKDPTELEGRLHNVCKLLAHILDKSLTSTRNEIIIAAACRLVANSITLRELNLAENSTTPKWKKIVEVGLKHRHASVQEAAAEAMGRISSLKDCSADISRLIAEMKRGTPLVQRSLARLLGVVNWNINSPILSKGINYLLVRAQSSTDVEMRRCCFEAMPRILTGVSAQLTSMLSYDIVNALLDALIIGLKDYTTDQRGDVGSWVRIACIQGLTDIVDLLFRVFLLGSNSINNVAAQLQAYLPSERFHIIVAGVLRQGMEKLDNVRQEAGLCVMKLLNMNLPDGAEFDRWRLHGVGLLRQQFQAVPDEWHGWNDADWLFPRAMRLLEIPEYRKEILSGIVTSVGSKTDSTQRPVSNSFVEFAQVLPIARSPETTYSLSELLSDLINFGKANVTSNSVIVPVFQAFVLLLEADALRELAAPSDGWKSLRTLLDLASGNVEKIRNIRRIYESMKIVVNFLIFDEIENEKGLLLSQFLTHPFPRVRADTAEYFYIMLQRTDVGFETEKLEDILLETEWSKEDISISEMAAKSIIGILGSSS